MSIWKSSKTKTCSKLTDITTEQHRSYTNIFFNHSWTSSLNSGMSNSGKLSINPALIVQHKIMLY